MDLLAATIKRSSASFCKPLVKLYGLSYIWNRKGRVLIDKDALSRFLAAALPQGKSRRNANEQTGKQIQLQQCPLPPGHA